MSLSILVQPTAEKTKVQSIFDCHIFHLGPRDSKILGKLSSSLVVKIDYVPPVLGSFPCCLAVAPRTPGLPGLGLVGATANPRPARMAAG